MKKLFFISLLLFSITVSAQIKNYENQENSIYAYNIRSGARLYLPIYSDTTTANSYLGVGDSCGKMIFIRSTAKINVRTCSPKAWSEVGGGISQATITDTLMNYWRLTGNTIADGRINFLGTTSDRSLYFRTNNTERMVLDSTGDVSINTTVRDGRLNVGAAPSTGIGGYDRQIKLIGPNPSIEMATAANTGYLFGVESSELYLRHYVGGVLTATALRFNFSGNYQQLGYGKTYAGGIVVPTAVMHLAAGTTAASSSPLKFTSGSLMTSPEAGAVEFLTDKWYATITTGAARKELTLNDAALTPGTTPVATTNGRLTDGVILANTTYTPTLTNVTNVASSTAYALQYDRNGSTVTVSGKIDITATTELLQSEIGVSLPIASNFSTDGQGNGGGGILNGSSATAYPLVIMSDATNDRISIRFVAPIDSAPVTLSFSFTYRII